MSKKLKLSKRFLASLLTVSLLGFSCGYHLRRTTEINRVKGYLEDFITEDNYVDLSKISGNYDIRSFDGKYLQAALQKMDVSYVRITDSYIYDDPHVETFPHMNAVNYGNVIWNDGTQDIYEMYEPIRESSDDGVQYVVPEGFTLEMVEEIATPIRYDELGDREVVAYKNDYEDSYTLTLEKK